MDGASDQIDVTVIIFSPKRENLIRARQNRLPADASRDAIVEMQNRMIEAIFDELDEDLGWPVDREAVQFILRDPK